ncbi:hypothetical protein B0E53_03470 [Micromonospora sp. MH33]|nr:hypothetical protein B0E53_03470 [Micromonospora sp. MH33]
MWRDQVKMQVLLIAIRERGLSTVADWAALPGTP